MDIASFNKHFFQHLPHTRHCSRQRVNKRQKHLSSWSFHSSRGNHPGQLCNLKKSNDLGEGKQCCSYKQTSWDRGQPRPRPIHKLSVGPGSHLIQLYLLSWGQNYPAINPMALPEDLISLEDCAKDAWWVKYSPYISEDHSLVKNKLKTQHHKKKSRHVIT